MRQIGKNRSAVSFTIDSLIFFCVNNVSYEIFKSPQKIQQKNKFYFFFLSKICNRSLRSAYNWKVNNPLTSRRQGRIWRESQIYTFIVWNNKYISTKIHELIYRITEFENTCDDDHARCGVYSCGVVCFHFDNKKRKTKFNKIAKVCVLYAGEIYVCIIYCGVASVGKIKVNKQEKKNRLEKTSLLLLSGDIISTNITDSLSCNDCWC